PLPPWSRRPPASRCCCGRRSSWSGGSAARTVRAPRRGWPRPSTGTPRSAPRGPAGPWAASGRCTTRWRSTGTGACGGAGGAGCLPVSPSARVDQCIIIPPGRRRAQLRCCLERLKQQVPVGAGPARPTTLSLLHRARLHIQVRGWPWCCSGPCALGPGWRALSSDRAAQLRTVLTAHRIPQRLEEQELRARKAKDRLRNRQRSLQQRLEWLLSPAGGERARADSLDSSQLSEASEEEDVEIEVDGTVFSGDLLPSFGSGRDHSYSSPCIPAS
uniref:MAX dimerization protein 3 n=1 Tax=Strigops habroptila TaxID=2489341 RepID=A0A672UVN5_STRHB